MKKQDNAIIGIYKITNPKGKVYIGRSKNVVERWRKYQTLKCEKQPKIFNSLKKYGVENHKFEIIEECMLELLDEREIYYKKKFMEEHEIEDALFCHIDDGNSGPSFQIIDSNIKRSKSLKNYYNSNNHSFKGKKRNKNFIENHYKPILQYTLDGEFIKEWSSQIEVKNQLGIQINNCLKNKYKSSGGFQWKYKIENYFKNIEPVIKQQLKQRTKQHNTKISKGKIGKGLKPILQLDINNNLIKEWESQSKASKEMNIPISCINLCLKGKNKTSNNFKWIYKYG